MGRVLVVVGGMMKGVYNKDINGSTGQMRQCLLIRGIPRNGTSSDGNVLLFLECMERKKNICKRWYV